MRGRGFTLVELVVCLVVLSLAAAALLPRFALLGSSARSVEVKSLAGAVNAAVSLAHSTVLLQGAGSASGIPGVSFVSIDGVAVRIWNAYPDRWCDGIANMLAGTSVPSGGCYLSTAPIKSGAFSFYGFSNTAIPNGDAGWRIEAAPNPSQCAVGYRDDGSGMPVVNSYTGGC